MAKQEVRVGSGSGWVNQVASQTGCASKTGHFKQVKKGSSQSCCRSGRVRFTRIFHIDFKKESMYLPFKKSHNKLLDLKCITLNSTLHLESHAKII